MAPEDVHDVLDRQLQVLELMAATTPLDEVLTTILQGLEQLMPGARCSVLIVDREQGTLHHGAAPSLPADYVAVIDGMSIGDDAGSCGTAAWSNAAVVAVDVRSDARWDPYRDAALAAGLTSCWSTPIDGRDGLPVGTFAVYHPGRHDPSPREKLLVDRFTHLASVAIEHALLLGELVHSEERFRRSFDDNALGMAIIDLDRCIVTCNDALAALLGSPAGALIGRDLGEVLEARGRDLGGRLDELGRRRQGPVSGHARRDLAIVRALRRLRPDVDVEWLAQHPVTAVLEPAGETIHPASAQLLSECRHFELESVGHQLDVFGAFRSEQDLMAHNFRVFRDVLREGTTPPSSATRPGRSITTYTSIPRRSEPRTSGSRTSSACCPRRRPTRAPKSSSPTSTP
jgi:GAF domain-containing protein